MPVWYPAEAFLLLPPPTARLGGIQNNLQRRSSCETLRAVQRSVRAEDRGAMFSGLPWCV